jgi:hypothetical protein
VHICIRGKENIGRYKLEEKYEKGKETKGKMLKKMEGSGEKTKFEGEKDARGGNILSFFFIHHAGVEFNFLHYNVIHHFISFYFPVIFFLSSHCPPPSSCWYG